MADDTASSGPSAALRLLRAVAGELRDLANETMRFGETLSQDAALTGTGQTIGLLQRFDVFVQSLQAHASLVDDVSVRLESNAADVSELGDLIERIPFFAMRERLRGVLNGLEDCDAAPMEDMPEDHWF